MVARAGRGPVDLRVSTVRVGGSTFSVLSYPVPGGAGLSGLTAAEQKVLQELLAGRSNEAIAQRRGTAVRTVANQVAAIFRKLGVSSRSELAALLAGTIDGAP